MAAMKRRYPVRGECPDIFGNWIGVVALTASKTECLPLGERQRIQTRVHLAYEDIANSTEPSIRSWRDATDCVNFLESSIELGWALDEDGAVEAAKTALHQCAVAFQEQGRIRMTAESLSAARNCLEQFDAILGQLSAHSYWVAVSHTKNRVRKILRGARQRGDIVVTI